MSDDPTLGDTQDDQGTGDLLPQVDLHDKQTEARLQGYSWGDIHGHVASSSAAAIDAGYTQPEIDNYLGLPDQRDLMHRLGVSANTMLTLDPDQREDLAKISDVRPEEGKPADYDLSSDEIRGHYADALMSGEARGPADFARLYTGAVQNAANNFGLNLSDGQKDTLDHASGDFASRLPSNSELTDQAIGIAHEAGVEVNPDSVRVVKNNLADYWAATGDKDMYTRAINDPQFLQSVVYPPKAPEPPSDFRPSIGGIPILDEKHTPASISTFEGLVEASRRAVEAAEKAFEGPLGQGNDLSRAMSSVGTEGSLDFGTPVRAVGTLLDFGARIMSAGFDSVSEFAEAAGLPIGAGLEAFPGGHLTGAPVSFPIKPTMPIHVIDPEAAPGQAIRRVPLQDLPAKNDLMHSVAGHVADTLADNAGGGPNLIQKFLDSGLFHDVAVRQSSEVLTGERVANPIQAFHASPHDFDRFSTEHLGTGEAGRAKGESVDDINRRGNGLYFSTNPDIHDFYKASLGVDQVGGKPYDLLNPEHRAAQLLANKAATAGDRGLAIEYLSRKRDATPVEKEAIDVLKSGKELPEFKEGNANEYKVALHMDPDKVLDLDKDLRGEAERLFKIPKEPEPPGGYIHSVTENGTPVRTSKPMTEEQLAAFRKAKGEWEAKLAEHNIEPSDLDRPSQDWFDRRSAALGSTKKATDELSSKGIHGTQYLDAASRGSMTPERMAEAIEKHKGSIAKLKEDIASRVDEQYIADRERAVQYHKDMIEHWQDKIANYKEPTRNYVVFHDSRVQMLEKNGQRVTPEMMAEKTHQLAESMRLSDIMRRLMTDESGSLNVRRILESNKEYSPLARLGRRLFNTPEEGPPKVRDLLKKPFLNDEQRGDLATYREGEDVARDVIRKNRGLVGDAEVKWAEAKLEGFYKDLEPHMPEYLAEMNKGPAGNVNGTVIGRIKNAIEGNISGGAVNPNGKWGPFLQAAKEITERNKGNIEAVLPDFESRVTHYYAHMYKNPRNVTKDFLGYGRQGSGASLNQREIPYESEAIARGHIPRYPNPIDNVLAAYGASQHHLAWRLALEDGNDAGHVKWGMSSPEPGWQELNGAMTTKMFVDADGKPQMLKAYGSPGFARNYNNAISTGFHARQEYQSFFDRLMNLRNGATQINLLAPFYHMQAMAEEAITAGIDHAMSSFYGGKYLEGVKGLVAAAKSPVGLYRRGQEIQKAMLEGTNDPVIKAIWEAGANPFGRQQVYLPGYANSYWKTFARGSTKNELVQSFNRIFGEGDESLTFRRAMVTPRIVGFMGRELGRVIKTLGEPLFDKYVPAVKTAVNYAKYEKILRDNPTATPERLRQFGREIVDDTDNRFGELNQDNLFWPRMTKNILNLLPVSLGWEYGFARLMSSAVRDVSSFRLNTPAARWAVAFPVAWAVQSTIYQALMTGTTPFQTGVKNFMWPLTGGTTPEGKPETATLPGYQKDELSLWKAITTAHSPMELGQNLAELMASRRNSLVRIALGVLTGQDDSGRSIKHMQGTHPQFGIPREYWNYGAFIAKEMSPFTTQQERYKGTAIPQWQRWLGIRPSSGFVDDPERFEQLRQKAEDRTEQTERAIYNAHQRRLEDGHPIPSDSPGRAGGGPGSRGGRSRTRDTSTPFSDDRYQGWGSR